jgi:hypothetical protein
MRGLRWLLENSAIEHYLSAQMGSQLSAAGIDPLSVEGPAVDAGASALVGDTHQGRELLRCRSREALGGAQGLH